MTENRQARTLQNSENFVLSQNGVRKYFFGKIICSTDQKKHFFNIWGSFWKIEFLTENRQARTLQNSENFVLSKWGKKIFFGKIICSTHQKKHLYNIWGSFWKIEFLTENWQARTLQNSENFVLSQNGVRKYFLANYLFDSSKEHFYNIWDTFWKIELLTKISRRGPYKKVKILYYLKMGLENILWQNYLFHSSKETFCQNLRQFLENWIFDGKSTGANLTK